MLYQNFRSVNSAAVCMMLIFSAVGCNNNKTTSMNDAYRNYESGRYLEAYNESKDSDSDSANFIAGVSAYRLGKAWDAIRHLKEVSNSVDPNIHTGANNTLGLIYEGRKDYSNALVYYRKSLKYATGEDYARTHYQIGVIEQKIGQWANARSHFSLASTRSKDPTLRTLAMQKLNSTGFTIQLGAYSSRRNADKRVKAVAYKASFLKQGAPKIILSKTSAGLTRYLVQVGRYSTYESAQAARRRLGLPDSAVVSLTAN